MALVTSAKDAGGRTQSEIPALPIFVSATTARDFRNKHGGSHTAPLFWFQATCGLVLSSVSPWEVIEKERGVSASSGYVCKFCNGRWKPGKGHSRMLTIMDGYQNFQLVVHEPPGREYARFLRDRAQFEMRLNPNDIPRDVPLDPAAEARRRVFLSEETSEVVWKTILSTPSPEALHYVDHLARQFAQA